MTFSILELSRSLGRPIGMLVLSRGALVERYTTGDRPIVVAGDTYTNLALSRSAIRDSTERVKNRLTLTLPIDAPCVAWWRPFPPSTTVGVTWLAKHIGDADVVVEW